jgi:hypothetical protein
MPKASTVSVNHKPDATASAKFSAYALALVANGELLFAPSVGGIKREARRDCILSAYSACHFATLRSAEPTCGKGCSAAESK